MGLWWPPRFKQDSRSTPPTDAADILATPPPDRPRRTLARAHGDFRFCLRGRQLSAGGTQPGAGPGDHPADAGDLVVAERVAGRTAQPFRGEGSTGCRPVPDPDGAPGEPVLRPAIFSCRDPLGPRPGVVHRPADPVRPGVGDRPPVLPAHRRAPLPVRDIPRPGAVCPVAGGAAADSAPDHRPKPGAGPVHGPAVQPAEPHHPDQKHPLVATAPAGAATGDAGWRHLASPGLGPAGGATPRRHHPQPTARPRPAHPRQGAYHPPGQR